MSISCKILTCVGVMEIDMCGYDACQCLVGSCVGVTHVNV